MGVIHRRWSEWNCVGISDLGRAITSWKPPEAGRHHWAPSAANPTPVLPCHNPQHPELLHLEAYQMQGKEGHKNRITFSPCRAPLQLAPLRPPSLAALQICLWAWKGDRLWCELTPPILPLPRPNQLISATLLAVPSQGWCNPTHTLQNTHLWSSQYDYIKHGNNIRKDCKRIFFSNSTKFRSRHVSCWPHHGFWIH